MHSKFRKTGIFLAATLFLGVAVFTWGAEVSKPGSGATRFEQVSDYQARLGLYKLTRLYSAAELSSGSYVGSEFCLSCHTAITHETAEWRDTKHAYFIRKPMAAWTLQAGKGVMANSLGGKTDDFMGGLDFNTLSGTAFDAVKPNAPVLSYDSTTDRYYMQFGSSGAKLLVVATLAGQSVGNGQRYMVRVPAADSSNGWSSAIYFGPAAWGGSSWSANKAWYNADNTPKIKPGSVLADLASLQGQNWMKNCGGCHMTGVRGTSVTKAGEYVVNPYPAVLVPSDSPNYPDLDGDGLPDMAGIGCESCHGPGSAHILANGDAGKIVNPARITNNQQRSKTCLQCHVQIASAPNKTWGFTFDEKNNKPFVMSYDAQNLDDYQVFTGGMWPDGWNFVGARIDSFKGSDHYKGAHGIACNDCHNSHAETTNDAQVRDTISRNSVADIPASVDNNSFCLSCHATHGPFSSLTQAMIKDWDNNRATISQVVSSHTHHPDGAERTMGLSRCATCHMAPTAGHGGIEGATHTFWPARPEDTIALKDAKGTGNTWGSTGNVNSCSASCHRGKVLIWSDVAINPTPNDNKFATDNEIALANWLVKYFGPDGLWWNTKK